MRQKIHETIAKVSDDFGRRYAFNTAIASCMELLNAVAKFTEQDDQSRAIRHEAFESLVLLLTPITPHVCQALWNALGHSDPVHDHAWPHADPDALRKDALKLAVQVNGKLRGTIEVPVDAARETVEAAALANADVKTHVGSAPVKKIVYVPGKIVSIVI
jgi:leucyl-tRNA synthetase